MAFNLLFGVPCELFNIFCSCYCVCVCVSVTHDFQPLLHTYLLKNAFKALNSDASVLVINHLIISCVLVNFIYNC